MREDFLCISSSLSKLRIVYPIALMPFLPGVCCWHQVGAQLPRSLQCAAPKEKTPPQDELTLRLDCPLHSAQQALCAHHPIICLYVDMQLCLNSVAAI